MFVVAMVVAADLLRDDTGLLTGLLMGAILVRWPPQRFDTEGQLTEGQAIQMAKRRRRLRERIATLSGYLIGILFIILSARVSPHQIGEIGWVSLAFVGVLVLVGRPLPVGPTTLRTALCASGPSSPGWRRADRRRRDLVHVRPRPHGRPGSAAGREPDSIAFIVIVATALIYGLSGAPWRALGVASTGPEASCWSA
jgi:hypothetical protein